MSLTADPAGTVAQSSRAAGYTHRVAIAGRFAEHIAAGDAVFMQANSITLELPHTVSAGARLPITGLNRWMLMQVMQDQLWRDPRFFTLQQVQASGWSLAPGARHVALQFARATDAQGIALPVPEIKHFRVFNASAISGVPDYQARPKLSKSAVATAMKTVDFGRSMGLLSALSDWVGVRHRESGGSSEELQGSLARTLALRTVAAELDLGAKDEHEFVAGFRSDAMSWPAVERLIRTRPDVFFGAVREAELVASELLVQIGLAQQQVQGDKDSVKRFRSSPMTDPPVPYKNPSVEDQAMFDRRQDDFSERSPKKQEVRRVSSLEAYQMRLDDMFAEREAVLAVPFGEKDRAHKMGAVWYSRQMVWFVPKGADAAKFREWDPREHCLGQIAAEREVIESFRRDMEAIGLDTSLDIKADGKWHSVRAIANKGKNNSGAYILNLSGVGSMNNKYSGEWRDWTFDGLLLTPEQKGRMRAEAARRADNADRERRRTQDLAAQHATEIVARGVPAHDHPYVLKKGITAEGVVQVRGDVLLRYPEFVGESGKSAIRRNQMYLIVPGRNSAGELRMVQAISEDGSVKSFMRGAQKKGTMATLGAPSLAAICARAAMLADPVVDVGFVEGFATGASFCRVSGMPVVVCFDAGNLEAVAAEAARKLPPNARAVLAVDNDQFHVERALGFLAAELGVNPNSQRGSVVEIVSGTSLSRRVLLGDAIADGEWHQAPNGRYCMSLDYGPDDALVRAVTVEAVGSDGTKKRALFNNRGVEAGRAAVEAFVAQAKAVGYQECARAVILPPAFARLDGRPSDWNDLELAQGAKAVTRQVLASLGRSEQLQPAAAARSRPLETTTSGPER